MKEKSPIPANNEQSERFDPEMAFYRFFDYLLMDFTRLGRYRDDPDEVHASMLSWAERATKDKQLHAQILKCAESVRRITAEEEIDLLPHPNQP